MGISINRSSLRPHRHADQVWVPILPGSTTPGAAHVPDRRCDNSPGHPLRKIADKRSDAVTGKDQDMLTQQHASWEQIDEGTSLGQVAGFALATYLLVSMVLLFTAPHI